MKTLNSMARQDGPMHQDRDVNNRLMNYIKGSVNMEIDINGAGNKEENEKFDLTQEGIRIKMEGIYLNQHVDTFISVKERAKHYEK